MLLLLPLAIVHLRRRLHVWRGGLGPKYFNRPPMTPHLPIQTPPASICLETPSGPNLCVDTRDPEKGIGYSVPVENPFTDDARVKLPSLPEMSVVRDAYGGNGQFGQSQVPSNTVRRVSLDPCEISDE